MNIDVVIVSCKTPNLVEIAIKSFIKFCTSVFNLNFIIVENSEYDLESYLKNKNLLDNVTIVNNPIQKTLSVAHGEGLEFSKKYISSDYVFTCHSDICVTSTTFFDDLEKCIQDNITLTGVCEDMHPNRIKALHCSGLLVDTNVFKTVSMLPQLPKIDTADLLTVHCRDNDLKMKLFKNTYNIKDLVDLCNSPYKELGKKCGIDRCLDENNNVMFMHQGRGTTKSRGQYYKQGKIMNPEWIKLCESILTS